MDGDRDQDQDLEVEQEQEPEHKGIYLFGRDLSRIPCFRNSFLYGISSGIGTGLLGFLATSRPQMSMHCGMGGFFTVTLAYWFRCRYEYSVSKQEMQQVKFGLQRMVMHEGTSAQSEAETETEQVE